MVENKKIIEGTESIATRLRGYTIYYIIVGIFIIFAIFLRDKGFLSVLNIMNIFRQTAMISVMAVGFTFVLASGEIDLSIGSTVALASLIGAVILRQYGMTLAILLALGVGAFVGFLNGVFTVKLNMPSFLVTIAMMSVVQGFARWITHLAAIPVTDQRFAFVFGNGNVGPISILFIWTIVAVFIGHLVISKTSFGRKVLAAGGNKTAAIFSGINVGNVKWLLFIVMGILAALAGLLYTGRMLAGRYDFGQSDLLTVIAAVIIGGNSISGGKGTVIGALIGSVMLGMINNGLILFGLSLDQQIIFRGVIILVAVALSPKET